MTDAPADPNAAGSGAGEAQTASLRILAQFTRDLSFENPNAPDSLRGGAQPQIEISVEVGARGRTDGLFEVDVKLNAKADREGASVFQVELLYGGLFEIAGVPDEHLEPLLLIECPRLLFPFMRRIVADVASEGGFPSFLLEPIDFGMLYAARQQQAQQLAEAPAQGQA
jgi:preprotein translocase subunit SecB